MGANAVLVPTPLSLLVPLFFRSILEINQLYSWPSFQPVTNSKRAPDCNPLALQLLSEDTLGDVMTHKGAQDA